MSHNQLVSRVVRPLAYAFTMVLSLVLSISMFAPAHAGEDFTANPAVVNDAAGVMQDWFTVQGDGMYGYFYDEAGSSVVPEGRRVYTTAGVPFTIYARHYTGTVKTVPVAFTNTPGTSAPNTVTFTNAWCDGVGSTYFDVYWNQTADGTRLESYQPTLRITSDDGKDNMSRQTSSNTVVPDGQSVRFDTITIDGDVWLDPGWHTLYAGEYSTVNGVATRLEHSPQRLWVGACGGRVPPAGQIPPGGAVPPPNDPNDPSDPNNPDTGNSAKPTGKLKFLARTGYVKATAINSKAINRSTFRLLKPGVKKATLIKAPAGKVVSKRVRALKPGKYRLMAPVWVNGKVTGYRCVDTLKLVRKR